uniref:ERI1 exoribonuclease 3-like n=1 Tax=Myxine glutinosa TaxID=7769 RepID=UPI00358DDD7C
MFWYRGANISLSLFGHCQRGITLRDWTACYVSSSPSIAVLPFALCHASMCYVILQPQLAHTAQSPHLLPSLCGPGIVGALAGHMLLVRKPLFLLCCGLRPLTGGTHSSFAAHKMLNSTSTKHSAITATTLCPRHKGYPRSFPPADQDFDFFLVLDFEATCDHHKQIVPQEIIEFPIVKVSGKSLEIESVFHRYVQPTAHPELTTFCTQLTGIIQSMVDNQPTLEQVLQQADEWMKMEGLLDSQHRFIFVTCGDWDLKVMLPGQCKHLGLPLPEYFHNWVNIKKAYAQTVGNFPRNLASMLNGLQLQHVGRHHSGLGDTTPYWMAVGSWRELVCPLTDDCKNITAILRELALRNYILKPTGCLQTHPTFILGMY